MDQSHRDCCNHGQGSIGESQRLPLFYHYQGSVGEFYRDCPSHDQGGGPSRRTKARIYLIEAALIIIRAAWFNLIKAAQIKTRAAWVNLTGTAFGFYYSSHRGKRG